MPFTLVGWQESITPGAALTILDALTDEHITEIGDNIQVPSDLSKIALAASFMLQIIDNYLPEGIQLDPGEQMNAYVQAPSGTIPGVLLVWLFNTIDAIPSGERFSIRFTAGTAAVGYTWGSRAITLSENLLAGRYAVVGARVLSTTLIAFRLIFTGQSERPGALGVDAYGDIQHPVFRDGSLGVWGEFEHNELPRLEVLAVTTDSAFVGYLDLIKIA